MSGSTTKLQQSGIIENHDVVSPQNPPNSLSPKLRKGAKAKYIIEEHPILDDAGKVVRTRHTGDTYHCFFYVKDEKKWLRKSLHTKKLPEALEAGCVFHGNWTLSPRQTGQSERSDAGVVFYS